jgi:mRNA interferase HigB
MRRCVVRVISRKAITDASAKHREWGASLNAWYKIAKAATWSNFEEVKSSWKNSDKVGKFVVFDVSHNRCRLICTIKYAWKMVYIRGVLSHAEYDRKNWENG